METQGGTLTQILWKTHSVFSGNQNQLKAYLSFCEMPLV